MQGSLLAVRMFAHALPVPLHLVHVTIPCPLQRSHFTFPEKGPAYTSPFPSHLGHSMRPVPLHLEHSAIFLTSFLEMQYQNLAINFFGFKRSSLTKNLLRFDSVF
jgi:hypothetical protein